MFMRSGCTHLLFIDADIGFTGKVVLDTLALSDPMSDKDIICVGYPKKTIAWYKVKKAVEAGYAKDDPNVLKNFVGDFVINPVSGTHSINISKLVEIGEGGTGFMLIQRKALEKFIERYPQYWYKPDHARSKDFDGKRKIMQFFHCEIDKHGRYLSEDYWFCNKIRECGMKIWLAPWMNLSHTGTYEFVGNLPALANLDVSPTVDQAEMKPKGKK